MRVAFLQIPSVTALYQKGTTTLTDHIIAVLVPDQQRNRALPFVVQGRYSSNYLLPLLVGTKLDTLFNHIACELMPREIYKLRGDKGDDLCPVTLSAMLNDMLCDIVAELVDNQGGRASMQFL